MTSEWNWALLCAVVLAFGLTSFLLSKFSGLLPRDGGRAHAFQGTLSQGKPRGAGILFFIVFAAVSLVFVPLRLENLLYILLVLAAMLSGYLDDHSSQPWNEYKKGLIDLAISLITAVTFVNMNGSQLDFALFRRSVILPAPVYIALATILLWLSINAVNCSDGVDGLCGSMSLVSLASFGAAGWILGSMDPGFSRMILILGACLLAYLWFNAEPSRLMMGDAGSRAIGLFLGLCALKTGAPLLYIPLALMMILDGLPGLAKIFFLRFFKVKLFPNIRTPLHDHMRKNKTWSNTQTVFRFSILQMMLSAVILCALAALR